MSNEYIVTIEEDVVEILEVGQQGLPGPPGADGAQGAQGLPGADGSDGADPTFEALDAAGDVGTGADQLAVGNHGHADKMGKSGDTLNNYAEGSEALAFAAGVASLNVNTCKTVQVCALTEDSSITTSGVELAFKPIDLVIVHSGAARTLSWDTVDLGLAGASGNTEIVTIVWDGTQWLASSPIIMTEIA